MKDCRNCGARLERVFCDLGTSPLSNAYLERADLDRPEPHFPLRPYVCENCLLVQLPVFATPESIFGSDYSFFAGQSAPWRDHCERLVHSLVRRHKLSRDARVLEIASNDGTLLKAATRWTPNVTGVEPARNLARHAQLRGLATIDRFFGLDLARELVAGGYRADLVIATNVLAHAPDLDDFLVGVREVLTDGGVAVFEVPRLERLVEDNQFDTIYHEHFSYFTLHALADALARRGLLATEVIWLPTHGGSMRVTAQRAAMGLKRFGFEKAMRETDAWDVSALRAYAHRPAELRTRMQHTLGLLREEGRTIAGYGAPAKATTFLTYCGIDGETIDFIVDSTPAKQGRYQPGARIEIKAPEVLQTLRPEVIVILPWNWRDEIAAKIDRECSWKPLVLSRDEVLRDGGLSHCDALAA